MKFLLALLLLLVCVPAHAQRGGPCDVRGCTMTGLLKTGKTFISGPFVLSGAYSTTTAPLAINGTLSGTVTASGGMYTVNQWAANADLLNVGTANSVRWWDIEHNWGGAAMTGGRQTLNIHINQTAQSGNGTADEFYQALNVAADASFNEGGSGLTTATALGHNFTYGAYCRLNNGATNWYANACMEWDDQIATGASALKNFVMSIVHLGAHAVQGADADAGIIFSDQTGAVGWKNALIQVGVMDGQDPIDATNGSIIRWRMSSNPSVHAPASLDGIDLTLGEISNCAYASRDFCMKDSAGLQVYGGLLSSVSGGFTLDTTGYKITFASLASGTCASACTQGDWFKDATSGMIVKATTVVGGNVTVATAEYAGWQASAPGGAVTVTNMNPDRTGQTFTVNVTATQQVNANFGTTNATAIAIGNSGSTTTLAGTIKAGASTGVSCSGSPTVSFASVNGIVTHC